MTDFDRIDRRFEEMQADPNQRGRAEAHRDLLDTLSSCSAKDYEAWLHGFRRYHKSYVLDTLKEAIRARLDPDMLRDTLREAWPRLEALGDLTNVLIAFRNVGFTTDNASVTRPVRTVTLYRGCVAGDEKRLSWTVSLEMARYFAARNAAHHDVGEGYIIVSDVEPRLVLGYFEGEHEVIVDYTGIESYKLFEVVPRSDGRELRPIIPFFRPW